MEILVCIKEVPVTSTVTIDPESGKLNRDKAKSQINPPDMHALQAALDIKKKSGGKVTVITMGPETAKESLRECITLGADVGYLVSDEHYMGADTLATSYALAKAAQHLGDFDLVFTGTQTLDGDTGQVGPELAERLGLAQVTYVNKIEEHKEDALIVTRYNQDLVEKIEVKLPALLTITRDANEIGKPNIKSKMAAKKATFEDLTPDIIGAEDSKIGSKGSPTEVVEIYEPEELEKGVIIQEGTEEESVKKLVDILVEKQLIG
ncbi:MAG: electron transfer flavoprotein subunit beta/FixA family protein [Tissierellia bacterium]|nr:electron transfer flavoprotein subunit beta/FixA family protein [Tissierellia bacterium]